MAESQFSRPFTVWDCLDQWRPLRRRIETERRRLDKANALLTALECALHEEEIEPVVAADATSVVRALIDDALKGLDVVSLAGGEAKPPATVESSADADTMDDEKEDDGPDLDEDDQD